MKKGNKKYGFRSSHEAWNFVRELERYQITAGYPSLKRENGKITVEVMAKDKKRVDFHYAAWIAAQKYDY